MYSIFIQDSILKTLAGLQIALLHSNFPPMGPHCYTGDRVQFISLNTVFAINVPVSMIMKALTTLCNSLKSTLTNDKPGESNCNTYDKELTSFINKEFIQTKNKKAKQLTKCKNWQITRRGWGGMVGIRQRPNKHVILYPYTSH